MIRLRTVKLVIFGEIPAAAERFKIFFLTLFVFRTKKGKTEYFANILNTLKAMKLLEGKVAVVTGAARGIGKAIALEFAKEGADVAFTDLVIDDNGKATEAEIAALGVKAKGYASNAANFEETHKVIEEIVKDFGRIDILVNNAGITKDGLMMRMSEAQWDAVLRAVNEIKEFRYRTDSRGNVIWHDTVDVISPIAVPGRTFYTVRIPYHADFERFYAEARAIVTDIPLDGDPYGAEKVLQAQGDYDVFLLSATPDLYFTSLTYAQGAPGQPTEYPLMNAGKAVMREGRLVMPLSIFVNHAFVDGAHISRFFKLVEECLKRISA